MATRRFRITVYLRSGAEIALESPTIHPEGMDPEEGDESIRFGHRGDYLHVVYSELAGFRIQPVDQSGENLDLENMLDEELAKLAVGDVNRD